MKKAGYILAAGLILFFSACGSNTNAKSQSSPDNAKARESNVTQQEAHDKAIAYYPEGVALEYARQDKICDETHQDTPLPQKCYIFDVTYNGKYVSGAAVGTEDGNIWFRHMPLYLSGMDDLWLSAPFMGLSNDAAPPKNQVSRQREPIIEIVNRDEDGITPLYFAYLTAIPELSDENEGSAIWNEKEQSLQVKATKSTGTVTGAIDGPSFDLCVNWVDGEPVLKGIAYGPAPAFSSPSQVLFSGEVLDIEPDRLLEIAQYFRTLIEDQIKAAEK